MTKQILLFIILTGFAQTLFGQHVFTWQRTYGVETLDDFAEDIVQIPDGDYVFTGSTNGFDGDGYDIFLVKLDRVGNVMWSREHGTPAMDKGRSLAMTDDGGFAIVGMTLDTENGDSDVFFIKTDAEGNEEFTQTYGLPTLNEEGFSLQATADGGYIITGFAVNMDNDEELYLIKTRADGSVQWSNTYGGIKDDRGHSVIITSDGGYAVAGVTESIGSGKEDAFLLKTDFVGNEMWARAYGNSNNNAANELIQTSDGGFLLTGYNEFAAYVPEDLYIVHTDANGVEIWDRSFGGSFNMTGHSISAVSSGGFIVAGERSFNAANTSTDVFLMRLGSTGVPMWEKTIGGSQEEKASSIFHTADGGFVVAGLQFGEFNGTNSNALVLKLSELGDIDTTFNVVVEENSPLPCADSETGAIDVWVTGGEYPYHYDWDREELSGFHATDLATGTYIVTVTGTDNQVIEQNITISTLPELTVQIEALSPESCNGLMDGMAESFVEGGTGEYTYEWDNGQVTFITNTLSAGLHTLTVTDENGCTVIGEVLIESGLELDITVTENHPASCANAEDGQFSLDTESGLPPYQYDIGDGFSSNSTFSNLASGLYSVTVQDALGCTTETTVGIEELDDNGPTATFFFQQDGLSIDFTADILGAVEHLEWDFGDGQTTNDLNPQHQYDGDGNYQVCLMVSNPCGAYNICQTVAITTCSDVPLTASFSSASNSFTAAFEATTEAIVDSYFWDFGDGSTSNAANPSHTFMANGLYEVCLTVGSHCGEMTACQTIEIDNSTAVALWVQGQISPRDSSISVPVKVKRFDNVAVIQTTIITGNVGIARIVGVDNFGIEGLDANHFTIEEDHLTLRWQDPTNTGISLEDSTTIFSIQLELIGTSGECTLIDFGDSPTPTEITQIENNTPVMAEKETAGGEVCRIDRVSIAGMIATEDEVTVNEVTVFNCSEEFGLTGFDGLYDFEIPAGGTCEVTPEKDGWHSNGVSTLDIVIIRKHILNTAPLNSPYKMIAADVNNSGTITGLDMVIIRKLVLNEIDEFPAVDSWRFVPAAYDFPNPANPFDPGFPESLTFNETFHSFSNQDFIAIKMGDVNNSAIPNFTGEEVEERTGQKVIFELPNSFLKKREMVRLPLKAKDFKNIAGFQMALEIDETLLDFQQIHSKKLAINPSNFSYQNGQLILSWTAQEAIENGISLDDNAILMELEFLVKKPITISKAIQLNNKHLNAEIYNSTLSTSSLVLQFSNSSTDLNSLAVQIQPNPTISRIQTKFFLPKTGKVQLYLYDVRGQLVKSTNSNSSVLEKGWQEIEVDLSGLEKGVYSLVIQTENGQVVEKVVKY